MPVTNGAAVDFGCEWPAIVQLSGGAGRRIVGDGFGELAALGQLAEFERLTGLGVHDGAIRGRQERAVGLPGFGGEVDQASRERRRRFAAAAGHIRSGAAAERAHVERGQLRVGHDQANRARRGVQLFGDDLSQRRADVLADLGLARVNGDLAVFANVQPGGDIPGRGLARLRRGGGRPRVAARHRRVSR